MKNLPRPRFVHHETHMEGPRRELGTPAMGGKRLTACATRPPSENNNILPNLIMSNEAHFHLTGFVNKQNYRCSINTNPQWLHETPLHSSKVTVWCGVARTVTSERYLHMLNAFLVPQLGRIEHLETSWFQRDGATAHTANISMDRLRQQFPSQLISRFGDIHWPSRYPDLSNIDFFLRGYLKEKIFSTRK